MTTTHKILLLFFLLYANSIISQSNSVEEKSFNLFGLSDYFISSEANGGSYVLTMHSKADGPGSTNPKNTSFTLNPLTKEAFIQNFFRNFAKFQDKIPANELGFKLPNAKIENYEIAKADSLKSSNYKILEDEATKLFYMFVARSIVINNLGDEPIAGTICYVDSLLILRRDIKDKSLSSRTKRLWKVYKKDKKVVKKLMKSGKLNSYLDQEKEVPDSTLKALSKELKLDTISGEFSFSEMTARLNRWNFRSSKEHDFLLARANNRKAQYDEAVEKLGEDTAKLNKKKKSLKAYEQSLSKIDSISLLETTRNNISQKLEKARQKDTQRLKDEGKPQLIYGYYRQLNFDVGSPKKDTLKIRTELLDFNDSINSLSCLEEKGKEWHTIINKQVKDWKRDFRKVLKAEKKELENSSDSTEIERNIKILEAIIKVYEEIPVLVPPFVCEYVQLINNLNNQQEILTKQIKLPTSEAKVSEMLYSFDTIKIDRTQIAILNYEKTKSDNIIDQIETYITKLDILVNKLQTDIDTLEENKRIEIPIIAEKEDLLVFKKFKVDSIVIEINEGFIENILMVGKVDELADKYGNIKIGSDGKAISSPRTLKFENSSPIGFSRKLDFNAIKGKKLYTRGGRRTQYETYLEDFLSIYIQQHEVGRRDYSPGNQKVVLKNNSTTNLCQGLKKEATYQLFEAKIFSDFVGLDETAPNGLIQTEISKRINLLTNRSSFRFLRVAGLSNEWNVGLLSYIEPSLTLSKIESNNKYLLLDSKDRFINNQYAPIKFTSTLQLKQFENFSASATANLLLLDMPNIKSTFFVNWGFRYGRTGIQDSIRTATNGIVDVNQEAVLEYGVNTFDHSPELIWSVYADERYGFSMSWQHHWFYLRDNGFEQVANTTFFENQVIEPDKSSNQYNTFRFLTTLEQSSSNKGRLFFRYTYNWQQGFWNTGFHQAQVGYSFYLLGRPKN